MSTDYKNYMLKKASEVDEHRWRFWALMSKGGRPIATSRNHTRKRKHAEMGLLSLVTPERVKGSEVHIARIRADGKMGMARPCKECEKALKLAGVKKIYYTTEKGWKNESFEASPTRQSRGVEVRRVQWA